MNDRCCRVAPGRGAALLVTGVLAASIAAAAAEPPPAAGTPDMPMTDYLALLQRISPAAHQGAQRYLQAVQQRCGRGLTTTELRRAVADADGDPVLMAMIRASHLQDQAALSQLALRVSCGAGGSR